MDYKQVLDIYNEESAKGKDYKSTSDASAKRIGELLKVVSDDELRAQGFKEKDVKKYRGLVEAHNKNMNNDSLRALNDFTNKNKINTLKGFPVLIEGERFFGAYKTRDFNDDGSRKVAEVVEQKKAATPKKNTPAPTVTNNESKVETTTEDVKTEATKNMADVISAQKSIDLDRTSRPIRAKDFANEMVGYNKLDYYNARDSYLDAKAAYKENPTEENLAMLQSSMASYYPLKDTKIKRDRLIAGHILNTLGNLGMNINSAWGGSMKGDKQSQLGEYMDALNESFNTRDAAVVSDKYSLQKAQVDSFNKVLNENVALKGVLSQTGLKKQVESANVEIQAYIMSLYNQLQKNGFDINSINNALLMKDLLSGKRPTSNELLGYLTVDTATGGNKLKTTLDAAAKAAPGVIEIIKGGIKNMLWGDKF